MLIILISRALNWTSSHSEVKLQMGSTIPTVNYPSMDFDDLGTVKCEWIPRQI